MKIALITWVDSYLYSEQIDYDHVFEVATITSTGFIVQEDEEKIVITQDNMRDAFRSTLAIPRVAVLSQEVIYSDEGSDDMAPTYFRTMTSHPYWKQWEEEQKKNPKWDISESLETGLISPEHFQCFIEFVQEKTQF